MASVKIKNLSKTFKSKNGEKTVLKDVSLEVKDKSFLVLLGPSGCGKSTLLRLIAGLETSDEGEIFIADKKVNDVHPKDRDIAFVFQSYALYPHLTVYENMAFPLKIRGCDKKTIDEKIQNAASILGLETLLKRKPKELSGGQRQRVALGRAIVREAKVFLMDEPLSNLDAKLRANMRVEIKKLHKKLDTTFIYVTHDQTEALTMGDEIVILNEGRIFQKGTPEEIFNTPINTFVASFSGNYPMNLIDAFIQGDKIFTPDFEFSVPKHLLSAFSNKNEIIIGIRPENVKIEAINPESQGLEADCGVKSNAEKITKVFDIDFIENAGAIKSIHLKTQSGTIKAVINRKENLENKALCTLAIDDFIYFDKSSGSLISAI